MLIQPSTRKSFAREISVMQKLGAHDHVVLYIGCLTLELGPALIMEYCELGDLLSFLRRTLKHAKTEVFSVRRTYLASIITHFLAEGAVTVRICKRRKARMLG